MAHSSHASADEPKPARQPSQQPDRRDFVSTLSSAAMAGGLVAGYGMFFVDAGRFLFSANTNVAWLFVTDVKSLPPGGSMSFESPVGVRVVITRQADSRDEPLPSGDDFLALSSTCPHLGCRVHWEPHNDRFFCPCHNGVFDPSGKATPGPPADAHQELPRYPLEVQNGLLFIQMPAEIVGAAPAEPRRSASAGKRAALAAPTVEQLIAVGAAHPTFLHKHS